MFCVQNRITRFRASVISFRRKIFDNKSVITIYISMVDNVAY